MNDDWETIALKAVISNDWSLAVKSNLKIIEEDPANLHALNRLAHAYCQNGQVKLACETYKRVLETDQFNAIALKNIALLRQKHSGKKTKGLTSQYQCHPSNFLKEPGKSKIVKLIRITDLSSLVGISSGVRVELEIRKNLVAVNTQDGNYLGCIPGDLSFRLIYLINGGNRYEAFTKSVEKNLVEIFITECFRSQRFHNQASF